MCGEGGGGFSLGEKGRKEEMQIQVWEGTEGRLKRIQSRKNQRGKLTKGSRDVA